MLKFFFILIIMLFSFNSFSNENLLTIEQQIERLQRDVSDLSQIIYQNKTETTSNQSNDVATNLSAIDMRIYDLEKDVKKITASYEDILFQLEDIVLKLNKFEDQFLLLENNILESKKIKEDVTSIKDNKDQLKEENSLGSLKISSDNVNNELNKQDNEENIDAVDQKLSPEDEFQIAFDNIRNKNWDDAENQLKNFIINYPDNQLSGSAHYWLGELYILKDKYRDAALVFAEGFQNFPKSIKAPDMLFKLSQSLYAVNKTNESCKTLEKLILDYPKNKLLKIAKNQLQDYDCLQKNE